MLRRRLGADAVHADAYATIIRNRFYDAAPELSWLREQAYPMLDERRIAHVAGCESEAIELAHRWGEDPETAAEAGILHDITKRLSHEEQLNLCEKYAIICDNAERNTPKLLHAKTGAAVARDLFGVRDPVYEAIRWHTTGKPDMTLLEKIVYLADYIEPTRDFPGIDRLRELARQDIDRAMLLGLDMTIAEVRSHGEEPYIDTLTAQRWYIERIMERRD
jgi:nicotinate-nucleotide adenylyltransferase